jgi:heme-degrading monooxygenase HmoA
MIALFFEVTPSTGNEGRYLDIAAALRPELEASGGVAFLDRYRSLARPQTMLSHQLWHDEASLARWRANARHHGAQTAGRGSVFEDYRLRVAAVIAARGEDGALSAREPGIAYNSPELKAERLMAVLRSEGEAVAPAAGETWQSVYAATRFAWVGEVESRDAGMALLAALRGEGCVSAAQLCLVSRDYGKFDRREAPQYFPPEERSRTR